MKVYRSGKTAPKWNITDEKSLSDWAKKGWDPAKKVSFDGTIQKSGERHTDLAVDFTTDDLFGLQAAFQQYVQARLKDLEERERTAAYDVLLLERTLRKIRRLVTTGAKKAPSTDALLLAVAKFAYHFQSPSRGEPLDLDWIKLDQI